MSFIKHFDFTEEKAKEAVAYCQEYMKDTGIYEARNIHYKDTFRVNRYRLA